MQLLESLNAELYQQFLLEDQQRREEISQRRRRNEARLLVLGGCICFSAGQYIIPDTITEQVVTAGLYTAAADLGLAAGLKLAGVNFIEDVPDFVRGLF